MEPVVIAVLIGIGVYMLVVALIPRHVLAESSGYTKGQLQQLEREATGIRLPSDEAASILREEIERAGFVTRVFFTLPFAKAIYPRLVKAGLSDSIEKFFLVLLIVFLLLVFALRGADLWSVPLALAGTYLAGWWYINRRLGKRNEAFLNVFPDALDMIVRSVRSGYPLNAAVRIVADNMQPPISDEFKRVADETAYGSTLLDSLTRLSYRIDEPDIRFFVVVLAVQQEVGGNLAEVLGNLAGIIRKRKHLRLKIKAMTSEGRATAWVLGLLPAFEFLAIYMVAPDHLTPFFDTLLGNLVLAFAIGIVLLGAFIVKQMVNMKV